MVRDRKLMIQALKSCNSQICWTEVLKLICDAADTLAQADDIISKKIAPPVAEYPKWISVKDRLPNEEELDATENWEFLCCCIIPSPKGGEYMRTVKVLQFDVFDKEWDCKNIIVTHWMECPTLPED